MTGMIYGYSEHRYGFHRLGSVRPVELEEEPMLGKQCTSHRLGLGAYFSSNNMFHQWFHAVPAFESLRTLAAENEDAVFVPLVGGTAANWTLSSARTPFEAHAWEFTLRALTAASSSEIGRNLRNLVGTASCSPKPVARLPCACFDRLEGSVGGFSPYSWGARSRYVEFKRAALAKAHQWRHVWTHRPRHLPVSGNGHAAIHRRVAPLLYIVRTAKRSAANEHEVREMLRASVPRLRFEVLETYPLAAQMWMIAQSAGLVGVHGQAFAWLPFLPFERQRTAAVEIMPYSPGILNKDFSFMYSRLGGILGINYTKVNARVVDGCDVRKHVLKCNVTIDAPQLLAAVLTADAWTRSGDL